MASTVHCARCGRDVPRPAEPNGPCPACQAPLATEVYEELHFETEQAVQPPAPRRSQSETSVAAARMAAAPSFKSTSKQGGMPIVPIAIGLILIVGIAAFALLRGQSPTRPVASPAPLDPTVVKVGRPPESSAPPVAEPEPAQPVITRDLPPDPSDPVAPAAPERKRQPERDLAAPATVRPARPPQARELAKAEKQAPATARPTPAPPPLAPPPSRPEPELPPPPPQFVAARPELPVSAPLQIGPAYAREGQRKARLTDPGCVANSLRLPRDIADVGGETATVKFAVDESGKVSQYAYLAGPGDQRVANAIWSAIQRCEFTPGATAQGKPVALWVTMPIKFGK
jgi:protein TonB